MKAKQLGSISPTCLPAVFSGADPKNTKRQSSHLCLFAILGSLPIKADCKTLVKLTLGRDFGQFSSLD